MSRALSLADLTDQDAGPAEALYQRVYRGLREGLMAGTYAPGQMLSLRRIAAAAGTSPMPVRQAMNRLIAEQALVLLPNRTVIVPRLSRSTFEELTTVRRSLEGMAAEQAARRASPELIEDLASVNAALHQAVARDDQPGALRNNQRFHFRLYEASASEVLLPLIEALWLRVGPLMHVSLTAPGSPWDASRHDTALHWLAAGDAEKVRCAIEEDIEQAAAELLERGVFEG